MKLEHNKHADKEYLDLLAHILKKGATKTDRTGTGTKSVFGVQMRFDLTKGFPLLTTKKVPFKMIVHELLWFLKGDTNIKYLVDNGVSIWNEWPYKAYLQAHSKVGDMPYMAISGSLGQSQTAPMSIKSRLSSNNSGRVLTRDG